MHPNDTLNGRLLAHELPEERHLRRKLGYWRHVEERVVRAELIAEGHDPNALGFWSKLSARIIENHKDDKRPLMFSGAIHQQAAYERDEMVRLATDAAVQALRDIRDGHNDPRGLAQAVLRRLEELPR